MSDILNETVSDQRVSATSPTLTRQETKASQHESVEIVVDSTVLIYCPEQDGERIQNVFSK
ncbi:sugar transferase, partial [Vibrio cholerae]|nr:sugar transferase [Vibrio cholerae]